MLDAAFKRIKFVYKIVLNQSFKDFRKGKIWKGSKASKGSLKLLCKWGLTATINNK